MTLKLITLNEQFHSSPFEDSKNYIKKIILNRDESYWGCLQFWNLTVSINKIDDKRLTDFFDKMMLLV